MYFANASGATLPPLTTATTAFAPVDIAQSQRDRGGGRPRRSVRRPAAHCGTATPRSRRWPLRGPSRLRRRTAATCAKVMSPATQVHQAIGDARRSIGSVIGCTGRRATVDIFGAPFGSTRDDAHRGLRQLDRRRHARGHAAAANRHEHGADVGALLQNLEAHRALADDDLPVIERRHDRQSALARASARRASADRATSCLP